jgi:hypothetical protein
MTGLGCMALSASLSVDKDHISLNESNRVILSGIFRQLLWLELVPLKGQLFQLGFFFVFFFFFFRTGV